MKAGENIAHGEHTMLDNDRHKRVKKINDPFFDCQFIIKHFTKDKSRTMPVCHYVTSGKSII